MTYFRSNTMRLTIVLIILTSACVIDPPGPRACECDLLEEWIAELPIPPGGDHFQGISIRENEDGFSINTSTTPLEVDDDHKEKIFDAFQASGLGFTISSDTEERWEVGIGPDPNGPIPRGAWRAALGSSAGLSLQIRVEVNGTPHGYETIDDVWQLYQDDRDAALQVQAERQQVAIEVLEPFRQAVMPLDPNT